MLPPASKSHYLHVRFTWDINAWLANAQLAVAYDLAPVGVGGLVPSLTANFDFEWSCLSNDPTQLESFALRPEKFAALGSRYEVFSTTSGEQLATIQDHKWNVLGLKDLTCECVAGHLTVSETAKSTLLGTVNLGLSRQFDLSGSFGGAISLTGGFGLNEYEISFECDQTNIAQINAVLVACVIVLTRSIGEHH